MTIYEKLLWSGDFMASELGYCDETDEEETGVGIYYVSALPEVEVHIADGELVGAFLEYDDSGDCHPLRGRLADMATVAKPPKMQPLSQIIVRKQKQYYALQEEIKRLKQEIEGTSVLHKGARAVLQTVYSDGTAEVCYIEPKQGGEHSARISLTELA